MKKSKYISSYSPKHVATLPAPKIMWPEHVFDAQRYQVLIFDELSRIQTPDEADMRRAIQETDIGIGFCGSKTSMKDVLVHVENLAKCKGKGFDKWRTLWGAYLAKRLTR